MILGVGVDLVDVTRLENKLNQNQALSQRIFTDAERSAEPQSLAGYWAAKEALIKSLGDSTSLSFQEMQVTKNSLGKPDFELSGQTLERVRELGVSKLHLSISHDGQMAVAMVVAEGN